MRSSLLDTMRELSHDRHAKPMNGVAGVSPDGRSSLAPAGCIVLLVLLSVVAPFVYQPRTPPAAIATIGVVTLVTAIATRAIRARPGFDSPEAPDPLYTLYLAAIVLVGPRPAIVLALGVPVLAELPSRSLSFGSVKRVLWDSVAAGATTIVAAIAFDLFVRAIPSHVLPFPGHLLAAMAATLVLWLSISLERTLADRPPRRSLLRSWGSSLLRPALRFQALLLVFGPLLPLAEVLDEGEFQLAWAVILVPLYAVYYLAILTTRLRDKTAELQLTVQLLSMARQREAELTGYAALITRAQEEERRRLARDLHDDTAQALVALSRGLDSLASRLDGTPLDAADARFVQELGDLANRSVESIRRACRDLRPSVLDDLGLAPALASLASDVTRRGLPCELLQSGAPVALVPEVEVSVYRIAQEALSNVRQHARATSASLELVYQPTQVRVCVRDDGIGFDYAATLARASATPYSAAPERLSGLGLLGMRERAALIGATLSVESAPASGTRITLTVPVAVAMLAPGAGTITRHPPCGMQGTELA